MTFSCERRQAAKSAALTSTCRREKKGAGLWVLGDGKLFNRLRRVCQNPTPTTHHPIMWPMASAAEFLKARDFLLAHRTDFDLARQSFRWPVLEEFNWALDYFDGMAAGNTATALWVVREDGVEIRRSFAELSARSNQVANFLRALGVRRGDHMLIMLGNEPELWEILLAACKLGAVVIPAATLLRAEDLRDRLDRGAVRHVVAGAAHTGHFTALGGGYTRISVGGEVPGWCPFDDACRHSATFAPDGVTHASDPLLLYFTSGTTATTKAGRAFAPELSGRSLVDHVLDRPAARRPALEHQLSRMGEACLELLVCTLERGGHGVRIQLCALQRQRRARGSSRQRDYLVVCSADGVAHAHTGKAGGFSGEAARGCQRRGAFESGDHRAGKRGLGHYRSRRVRANRKRPRMIGNPPGQVIKPGSMGRPLPGYTVHLLDTNGQSAGEGEVSLDLAAPPLGLMLGYAGEQGQMTGLRREGYYRTGDLAIRDEDGYLTYIGRADDVFKASDYRISPFERRECAAAAPGHSRGRRSSLPRSGAFRDS